MFTLPPSTLVKKVIPKNAFDSYTNTKQKKMFSEKVLRITWTNKLSLDTINIAGIDVEEIQIFEIELKEKFDAKHLLAIIDKAIPYHIIFIVKYGDEHYISTSAKHIHPTNEDNAVIDYTFLSDWTETKLSSLDIELKNNLDWVYKTFCSQFISFKDKTKNLTEFIENQKNIDSIKREIEKIKAEIASSKQFNKKVELNLQLKTLEDKMLNLARYF
ncbi:MAG: DUF4391 domain-containing protein [Weeksellaceae bacterium]|nr:DUF4391 domain-containing protein [Weeksellaceae bacterium]